MRPTQPQNIFQNPIQLIESNSILFLVKWILCIPGRYQKPGHVFILQQELAWTPLWEELAELESSFLQSGTQSTKAAMTAIPKWSHVFWWLVHENKSTAQPTYCCLCVCNPSFRNSRNVVPGRDYVLIHRTDVRHRSWGLCAWDTLFLPLFYACVHEIA